MTRTHTATWEDPLAVAAAAMKMSGLEFLQALQRGDMPRPPVAALLGMELAEVSRGRVVFAITPGEQHYNLIGSVHGGVLSTVLDSALGSAVHSTLPEGTGYTTLELHVNFVRAVTLHSGRLRCEGEIIYSGGRIATAQGRITGEDGALYAHATTTCLLLRPGKQPE